VIKRQRVYRRPDPTLATGTFREFKVRISCFHHWGPNIVVEHVAGTVISATTLPGERCEVCDATCLRGPDGRIVEYSTKAERELEEQERADREYALAHPEMVVA
jgi:hypothetical protein